MNSLGTQDLTTYDIASTVHGLPGISESGCALSFLSAQSQNSSDRPSGASGDHTSVMPNTSPHYNVSEVSQKLLGVRSQGLTRGNQKFFSLRGPLLICFSYRPSFIELKTRGKLQLASTKQKVSSVLE